MNSRSSSDDRRERKSMSLVPSATRANLLYPYASSTVARPPTRTAAFADLSPSAATASASGHDASTSSPDALRIIGTLRRSTAVTYLNAQRPLSQFHSSLTDASSPARRRNVFPRRTSVRISQPDAQCSHADGVDTKSNGRARNRYAAPVSAPTGQI